MEHLTKRFGDARRRRPAVAQRGPPSLGLALGIVTALLVVDTLAWRAIAPMFDSERLVTGRK